MSHETQPSPPPRMSDAAAQAVAVIIDDLSDRQGFDAAWSETDADFQNEIRVEWARIIGEKFPAEANLLKRLETLTNVVSEIGQLAQRLDIDDTDAVVRITKLCDSPKTRAALGPASAPTTRGASTSNTPILCADCGEPASCVGSYEGRPSSPACDRCCGHGNEDGRCEPLNKSAPTPAAPLPGATKAKARLEIERMDGSREVMEWARETLLANGYSEGKPGTDGHEPATRYFDDYETEPIGGGNPYHRCTSCGCSAPAINGRLEGHLTYCKYRKRKEAELNSPATPSPVATDGDER